MAVALRRLRADDAEGVLAAFVSSPDMDRQGDVKSKDDAEQYVQVLANPEGPHRAWAVTDLDRLIGLVCITVDEENRNGWFFYWMAREARGRGWTKSAAATVADWALREGGLFRLELGHRVNNPQSGAVATAAGFIKEGTERAKFLVDGERIDVDTYSRLRTDPWPEHVSLPIQQR